MKLFSTAAAALGLAAYFAHAANPEEAPAELRGKATYYHRKYIGRTMANGKPYDASKFTIACWDLPLGAEVRVDYTSPSGRIRSVYCVVTDRGPAKHTGNRFDLSWAAFRALENHKAGVIDVTVTVIK